MNADETTLRFALDALLNPGEGAQFNILDVVITMMVSSLLCYILATVYRTTYRGTNYSHAFLVTMMLMAVCTSVVMIIIGSNIARAFSLVGALSIIRFRTAVKDPRDTGYLFASIVAGMGCGTGFYMPVILLTMFVSGLLLLMYKFNFGLVMHREGFVRITHSREDKARTAIESVMSQSFKEFQLVNRVMDFGEDHDTSVYVVKPGRGFEEDRFRDALSALGSVVKMSVFQSDQTSPV